MTTTEAKTAVKTITLVFRGGKELFVSVLATETEAFLAGLMNFDQATGAWGCIVKKDNQQIYIRPDELQAIQVDDGDGLTAFGGLSDLFGLGR